MSLQAFCLADHNAIRPIDPETSAIWGFSFIYVVIGHTKVTAAVESSSLLLHTSRQWLSAVILPAAFVDGALPATRR